MRIDAHHHYWRFDPSEHPWMDPARHARLMRDFLPADLAQASAPHGVDAVLSVQARQSLADTEFLLGLARTRPPRVAAVVGWVELRSAEVRAQLDRFAADPLFRGVRHFISMDPDRELMRRDDFVRGLHALASAGLVFDLLLDPDQLPQAARLASELGELTMVLDHMGDPPVDDPDGLRRWRQDVRRLAACPNVACKLSGYATIGRGVRSPEMPGAVLWCLEAFGPERSMWAADWPVSTIRASYAESVAFVEDVLSECTPEELDAVMGGTAARVYGIDGTVVGGSERGGDPTAGRDPD